MFTAVFIYNLSSKQPISLEFSYYIEPESFELFVSEQWNTKELPF